MYLAQWHSALQVQALMTNAERYSLSAAAFTALTDVELEIDGLMSYDRAVIKMGAQPLYEMHTRLIEASKELHCGAQGEDDSGLRFTCATIRDVISQGVKGIKLAIYDLHSDRHQMQLDHVRACYKDGAQARGKLAIGLPLGNHLLLNHA